MTISPIEFDSWLREQDRSPVTVRGYLADLRQFSRWFEQTNGQALRPDLLTPADVREYKQYLQTLRRFSPATIRRHLLALRAWVHWAQEQNLIQSDPTARVKAPVEMDLSPHWLTKREQYALLREAERGIGAANTEIRRCLALRDWSLMIFLLNTGLRVAEMCSVDVEDVFISDRSGWVQVRAGKGNRARRVPLNEAGRDAVRRWLEVRGRLVTGPKLFGMSPSGVHRRLAEIGRRAGVAVHAHTLRHTMAKNLVDAGVGLEKVATLLGHSNLNTTRIYISPGERDLARAVEALE